MEESHAEYERSRLELMRGYAELRSCRRRYILNYFGEEQASERCAMCDNDLLVANAAPVTVRDQPVTDAAPPFAVGDHVVHKAWGPGVVQRLEDDSIIVLFESVGYKALFSHLVLERRLLERSA